MDMDSIKKWINGFLSDEPNTPSSKRLLGALCVLTLCFALIYSIFTKIQITLSDTLIDTIGALGFGLLGLTSVDKWNILKSKLTQNKPQTPEQEQ